MNHCSQANSQLYLNAQSSNLFWKTKQKNFTRPKWSQQLQTCIKSVFLFQVVGEGCHVSATWPSEHKHTLASTSVSLPCSSLPALKLRHLESWMTSSLPVMMVKCLFSLSWILALHLIPSITAFSSTGSNMLLAYRNLLFRSFDPIWLNGKRYPFLVTVQIPPLCVMVYPKVQFSVQYCFFCTHHQFHKLLTDTQFPIVIFADNSQLYNSVPREHLRSLISKMQACVADVKVWMMQNKLQLNNENNWRTAHWSSTLTKTSTFSRNRWKWN